jgi:uncharacterized protein YaaQ
MIAHSERKGNKLVLTIDLADKPYKSKSAIAKALAAGRGEETVPATMLASTGGFQRVGDCKVSLNVTTA